MTTQRRARLVHLTALPIFAALIAGCSGSIVVPGDDVTGSMVRTYINEEGEDDLPTDLRQATIQASFRDEKGDWHQVDGTGQKDGSFSIPGVPEGPFLLGIATPQISITYYTAERELDLGDSKPGTLDEVELTTATLEAHLEGLRPWTQNDWVEVYAADTGEHQRGAPSLPPPDGVTTLDGVSSLWSLSRAPATKSRSLYASQSSRTLAADGTPYSTIVSAGKMPVTLVGGGTTTASATLTASPINQSATIDVRGSEFASAVTAIHPNAVIESPVSVIVSTEPGAAKHGQSVAGPSLLFLEANTSGADTNPGALAFSNPLPSSWGIYGTVALGASVNNMAPDTGLSVSMGAQITMTVPLATLNAGPIRPLVTPVRELKINGRSTLEGLAGATTEPVVSWSVPAVGTPTIFWVGVSSIEDDGTGKGRVVPAWVAWTSETSMALPPGVLEEGKSYFFIVSAQMDPETDAGHPFRKSGTSAVADALTGVVTP